MPNAAAVSSTTARRVPPARREAIETQIQALIDLLDRFDAPDEDREDDDEDACSVEDTPIVMSRHVASDDADDETDGADEPSMDPASWTVWGGARDATPVSALIRRT